MTLDSKGLSGSFPPEMVLMAGVILVFGYDNEVEEHLGGKEKRNEGH